jgi:hypothetical protein
MKSLAQRNVSSLLDGAMSTSAAVEFSATSAARAGALLTCASEPACWDEVIAGDDAGA